MSKVKKCPIRKHCFDYKDGNCDNCEIGNELTKLNKRIDRLKKQNETLTIQRNAWALTAKSLGDKWICVDEKLPEKSGKYIVCNKSGVVFQAKYYTYPTEKGGHWGLKDKGSHITHWMPLPEAPKKGSDDESIH